jgi:hypothetical protein
MQSALVRSFGVLRQPQDDTRSGASNAGLLSGEATLNRSQGGGYKAQFAQAFHFLRNGLT